MLGLVGIVCGGRSAGSLLTMHRESTVGVLSWTILTWLLLPGGACTPHNNHHHEQLMHPRQLQKRSVAMATVTQYEYDFSGPRDIVAIMDVSQSIGSSYFESHVKGFLELLIKTAIVINSEYTRLAVITFASDVQTEFDYISAGSMTGCEMFADDGPWNQIEFIGGAYGSDINGALETARRIFSLGRVARPDAEQNLMILSDAENFQSNAEIYSLHLKEEGVAIYGVGVGYHLNFEKLQNLTSEPTNVYCRTYDSWLDQLRQGTVAPKNVPETWSQVDLCTGCSSGSACYCSNVYDFPPACYCEPGMQPDDGGRCTECPSDQFKTAFGNHSCTPCSNQMISDGAQTMCPEKTVLSIGVLAAIGITALLLLVCCIGIGICVSRRRKKARQKGVQCDVPETIYTQTYEGATQTLGATSCDIVNDVIKSCSQNVGMSADQLIFMRSVSNADSGISDTGSSHPILSSLPPSPGAKQDSDWDDIYENQKNMERIKRRPGNTANVHRGSQKFKFWSKSSRKSKGSKSSRQTSTKRGKGRKIRSIISMFEKGGTIKPPLSRSLSADSVDPDGYCGLKPIRGHNSGYIPVHKSVSTLPTGVSYDNTGYLMPSNTDSVGPTTSSMTPNVAYIAGEERLLSRPSSQDVQPYQVNSVCSQSTLLAIPPHLLGEKDYISISGATYRDYISVSGESSRSSGPYLEIVENQQQQT